MESFLNKTVDGNKFELTIDTKIFNKDLVLKTAYSFLDLGYFFFKLEENSIILQFTARNPHSVSSKGREEATDL